MTNIPYGRQTINDADMEAVQSVLRSDWLTQGPVIANFEQSVAEYCGAKYAVAVSNATAALHLACLAFKLGPGDYLWTSPNTFVASANCALYCGAQVDFVDVDARTFNISVAALAAKLEQAERTETCQRCLFRFILLASLVRCPRSRNWHSSMAFLYWKTLLMPLVGVIRGVRSGRVSIPMQRFSASTR